MYYMSRRLAISCILDDSQGGRRIVIFLPKHISMSGMEIEDYNTCEVAPIKLIFRGLNKRSSLIYFIVDWTRKSKKKISIIHNYCCIANNIYQTMTCHCSARTSKYADAGTFSHAQGSLRSNIAWSRGWWADSVSNYI